MCTTDPETAETEIGSKIGVFGKEKEKGRREQKVSTEGESQRREGVNVESGSTERRCMEEAQPGWC